MIFPFGWTDHGAQQASIVLGFMLKYCLLALFRPPKTALPKYQHMLNLPNFEDPPRHTAAMSPPSSHVTQQQPHYPDVGDSGGMSEGPVVHAQYNSPLQMYSSDNVEEAFKGQSGGEITAVKG